MSNIIVKLFDGVPATLHMNVVFAIGLMLGIIVTFLVAGILSLYQSRELQKAYLRSCNLRRGFPYDLTPSRR